jgi:hypothetical protein
MRTTFEGAGLRQFDFIEATTAKRWGKEVVLFVAKGVKLS